MDELLQFIIKGYESFFTALESVTTASRVILAVIGGYLAYKQLSTSWKIAKGEFLLRLDELFKQHEEVHRGYDRVAIGRKEK